MPEILADFYEIFLVLEILVILLPQLFLKGEIIFNRGRNTEIQQIN